ncbi:geminin-like [Myzus persicae]|uniref:geminin-like n=1 Tax=Myzus persicae TaxID=13164 RepID=UPI000B939BC1|nr:geminin-like [Myzus persicae]
MKTVSENNRNVVSDKMSNKKGTRKFLQTLQPSGGDKENLVGTGRIHGKNSDPKILKTQFKTEVEVKSDERKSVVAKVNPSLYKKLIIEDLTSTVGPSEKYWEVIAERRRKALEEVLEQNRKLHAVVMALEKENASCKKLLEQTTNLVNTLKEVLNEEDDKTTEDDGDNDILSNDSNEINSNNDFSGNESE